MTWDNLFPTFGPEPFDVANPTDIQRITNGATGTISFDVSEDVGAFLDGEPNHGWLLKDNGWVDGVKATFHSSESSNTSLRPKLIIETLNNVTVAGEATLDFGDPGVLTIDTSDGNEYVEVPENGMIFADQQELINWAVANLNAELVYDDDSNVIGARGTLEEIGDTVTVDPETHEVIVIDDILVALLGGQTGIVAIGGQEYCIREDGCEGGMAAMAPPAEATGCNASDTFCIKGKSFKRNVFGVIKTIGGKVTQSKGGFKRERHFCWKRKIFPWYCFRESGSNTLTLNNSYVVESDIGGGIAFGVDRFRMKDDVASIKQREFFFGVNAPPSVHPVGVCSFERGEGQGNDESVATSSGNVAGLCDPG